MDADSGIFGHDLDLSIIILIMNPRTLYSSYGTALVLIGLVGYFLTYAKSSLISGLVTGVIMIICSTLVDKFNVVKIIAKIFNVLFLGAFVWRSTLAMNAVNAGDAGKLIPALLISLMALISVSVFAISILKPEK